LHVERVIAVMPKVYAFSTPSSDSEKKKVREGIIE